MPTPAPAAPSPASSAAAGKVDPGSQIHAPQNLLPGEKAPFVLYLHGLGASGKILTDALKVDALARQKKYLYAAPDGALDSKNRRFWNASKSCCNLDGLAVDHVAELKGIIDAARARPDVDPRRIYVLGISNGGFMAHRLACEVPGIAAIASIAGAGQGASDPPCKPPGPVGVLEVHGDADDVIRIDGGQALGDTRLPAHPSAVDTTNAWANRNGCKSVPSRVKPYDLHESLDGYETDVFVYLACKSAVELWVVKGGKHMIMMGERAQQAALTFLEQVVLPQ